MKYIMVIICFYIYSPAVTTAEFNSKEACMAAGKFIKQKYPNNLSISCVPKG